MLEILNRIYKKAYKEFVTIKKERDVGKILFLWIEEKLLRDEIISDCLYKRLKNYLSGIQYLPLCGDKIYIRTEDKTSPLSFGRRSPKREKLRRSELYQKYREKYEILNLVINHYTKCEYVRISFTERQDEMNSIRVPYYISNKLANIWGEIEDKFLIQSKEIKNEIENKFQASLEDKELQQFIDINRIRMENYLFGACPADKNSLKTTIEDMLKYLVIAFQFHLKERKYMNQEIDSLFFPLLYDTQKPPFGAVFMVFAKILELEEIYFCIQMWRNISLLFRLYEYEFK